MNQLFSPNDTCQKIDLLLKYLISCLLLAEFFQHQRLNLNLMSATEKSFSSLAGIPIHYAREPIAPYGSKGVQMIFFCKQTFFEKLEQFVQDLIDLCPLGPPEVIVTAGVYVDKPNSKHQLGRAFDLDSIFWSDRSFITKNYPADKAFYLGIEAILRKHFGTVLQYPYDRRHEDHFHFDDGTNPDFNTSWQSYTYFAQTSLNVLFDANLVEDGIWGPETSQAVTNTFNNLGINTPITTKVNWIAYLEACIPLAFHLALPDVNPRTLLQQVYETIATANIDAQEAKRIETSLTAFAMHQESAEFLSGFA